MKTISKFIFHKLFGWKTVGVFPKDIKKYIIIGAPHTHWQDFMLGLAMKFTQKLPVNFIGKAYKDDIAYCYLEVENVSKIQSIEVINRLLFDVYTEQQNIVKLKLNNKNKSFLLIPDNDQCVLNFD